MDPVTATGLVASVVTFVEFSWILFASSHAIYRSTDGLPRNKVSVDAVAGDLFRLSEEISNDSAGNTSDELKTLAKTCIDIGGELRSALTKLKVKGKRTRWACLRAALKDVWKGGEIGDIQKRLDNVRAQLQVRLTANISMQCGKLASMEDRLQVNLSGKVQKSEQNILKAFESLEYKISQLSSSPPSYDSSVSWGGPGEEIQPTGLQNITTGSAGTGILDTDGEAQRLLRGLHFRTKEVRHAQIPTAHEKTFQWVFDNDASPFYSWLCSNDGVFWISGKAGSGKSTLMKLISNDDKTQKLLQQWSGSKKLVIAKHFFWKPGEVLQKSREGLLRSLLHQILVQCPELMPAVLEVLPHRNFDTWYLHELLDAFESLSRTAPAFVRLCLIIDGLDEYEYSKGYQLEELIELIRILAKQNWVKICVSSRPWINFHDAFGSDQSCLLKLEDLTRKDIETYVQDKLNLNPGSYADNDDLVSEIVLKAEGVFLWVYLAVCDLLQGIRDGDRPDDLFRKVKSFPPDLREFLQRILDSIDPAHEEEAAKHLKLALHRLNSGGGGYNYLPLLVHTFVGEIEGLEEFDHFLSSSQWDTEAFDVRLEKGRRRILSRCKGLLEIFEPVDREISYNGGWPYRCPTVHFFHRTVVELISDVYGSEFSKFEPGAFICKAYRVMLDIPQPNRVQEGERRFKLHPNDLITSAVHSTEEHGQPLEGMIRWIKEADSITVQHLDYKDFDHLPRPPDYLPKMMFAESCACFGFVSYVRLMLTEHPQPSQLSLRLTHVLNRYDMLEYGLSSKQAMYDVRKLLLEKLGGNVDLICPCCTDSPSRSIWVCTLTSFRRRMTMDTSESSFQFSYFFRAIIELNPRGFEEALDHIVPFDEYAHLRHLEDENPKGGLTARTILQRYAPNKDLQRLRIECLASSERQKYEW